MLTVRDTRRGAAAFRIQRVSARRICAPARWTPSRKTQNWLKDQMNTSRIHTFSCISEPVIRSGPEQCLGCTMLRTITSTMLLLLPTRFMVSEYLFQVGGVGYPRARPLAPRRHPPAAPRSDLPGSSRLLQNRLSCFAPVSLIRCWFHSFQQLTKRSNNIDNGKANPGIKWKFLVVSMATDSISSWPEADTMCEADGCAGCSSELKCTCSYAQ